MKSGRCKLTLDCPVTYQIMVPGRVDRSWAEWTGWMSMTSEDENEGGLITVLTGTVDQAGLQGQLRQLYSRGLPIISVICVDAGE